MLRTTYVRLDVREQVWLPTVASLADMHLRTTSSAQNESSSEVHQREVPMSSLSGPEEQAILVRHVHMHRY